MNEVINIQSLAKRHAKNWLAELDGSTKEEVKGFILDNIHDENYRIAIETEILTLNFSENIIENFRMDIENHATELRIINNMNNRSADDLIFTRLKPNKNNFVVNI